MDAKPCPFCGGEPDLLKVHQDAGKVYYDFGCWAGGCPTEACYVNDGYLVNPTDAQEQQHTEKLIERWNKRYEQPCRSPHLTK